MNVCTISRALVIFLVAIVLTAAVFLFLFSTDSYYLLTTPSMSRDDLSVSKEYGPADQPISDQLMRTEEESPTAESIAITVLQGNGDPASEASLCMFNRTDADLIRKWKESPGLLDHRDRASKLGTLTIADEYGVMQLAPSNGRYDLLFEHGNESAFLRDIVLTPQHVQLIRQSSITLRFVGESGLPVPGLRVMLEQTYEHDSDRWSHAGNGITMGDGELILRELDDTLRGGVKYLRVFCAGFPEFLLPSLEIMGAIGQRIDVTVPSYCRLRIEVPDFKGRLFLTSPEARLNLSPLTGSSFRMARAQFDESGVVQLEFIKANFPLSIDLLASDGQILDRQHYPQGLHVGENSCTFDSLESVVIFIDFEVQFEVSSISPRRVRRWKLDYGDAFTRAGQMSFLEKMTISYALASNRIAPGGTGSLQIDGAAPIPFILSAPFPVQLGVHSLR